MWDKTYGGNAEDEAYSIIETSDGYVVAGYTKSKGAGLADFWIIKLDKNGNVVWDKTYGRGLDDIAYSIIETSDGYYVVAGYTCSGAGGEDVWVIKLNRDGNIVWDKTYDRSYIGERATSIIETSDGCYVVAGRTVGGSSFGAEAWILKLDRDGNVQWQKTYGNIGLDEAYSIIETSDGYYVAAGWNGLYVWVIKLDRIYGNVVWDKTYGRGLVAYSIIETSDGGYIAAGYTETKAVGGEVVYILKLDP